MKKLFTEECIEKSDFIFIKINTVLFKYMYICFHKCREKCPDGDTAICNCEYFWRMGLRQSLKVIRYY